MTTYSWVVSSTMKAHAVTAKVFQSKHRADQLVDLLAYSQLLSAPMLYVLCNDALP